MSDATGAAPAEGSGGFEDLAGKFLTFILANEVYGLEILKVQEIIGLMNITAVPRTPDYIRGVINLRGRVIPVVELRKKFGMEVIGDNERTCIIVVQVVHEENTMTMAILVDEVSEVVDILAEQLEPTPSFGASISTEFMLAMGKVAEHVVILLDVDKVLSISELEAVSSAGEN